MPYNWYCFTFIRHHQIEAVIWSNWKSTVTTTLWSAHSYHNKSRIVSSRGRPRNNRMKTANIMYRLRAVTNSVVRDQTAQNQLHGLNSHARQQTLAANHRAPRGVCWTRHVRWPLQLWDQVKQSSFCLRPADRRIRIRRRRRARFANRCYGTKSFRWTYICHVVDNLTGYRYLEEIFQQDNAKPHVARVSRDFWDSNNI